MEWKNQLKNNKTDYRKYMSNPFPNDEQIYKSYKKDWTPNRKETSWDIDWRKLK